MRTRGFEHEALDGAVGVIQCVGRIGEPTRHLPCVRDQSHVWCFDGESVLSETAHRGNGIGAAQLHQGVPQVGGLVVGEGP